MTFGSIVIVFLTFKGHSIMLQVQLKQLSRKVDLSKVQAQGKRGFTPYATTATEAPIDQQLMENSNPGLKVDKRAQYH